MSGCAALRWSMCREGHLTPDVHDGLAALLRAAYAHEPQLFPGRRTWSYLRPEARVTGWDTDGPAAMAGVLRRFVQVGGRDQPVAMVGLVAVRPELQRHGVGLVLMRHVTAFLTQLAVPFGLLTCAPRHVGFYRRAGWQLLPPIRTIRSPDDTGEALPFVDEISATTMILPVTASRTDWPDGDLQYHAAPI